MFKRVFFKLRSPKLPYHLIRDEVSVKEIPLSEKAILLLEKSHIRLSEISLYVGKRLKTGEILRFKEEEFVSPVTGTVTHISEYRGYMNKEYRALYIRVQEDEEEEIPNDWIPNSIPGLKDMRRLFRFNPPINQVIIMGVDDDLFVSTNQLALRERIDEIKKGVRFIKQKAKVGKIGFAIFNEAVSQIDGLGHEYYIIKPFYPLSIPKMILKEKLKYPLPPGKDPEDMGIAFVGAEAVANMGLLQENRISFEKIITFINKDHSIGFIKARIGTPISYIIRELGVEINEGDRVVIGGPMRGKTVYSLESTPVDYDTDAILIQDRSEIISYTDQHCINCGECVKVCPTNVPVNMLVRLLENGLFEEAAKEYDLLSCIECGLCTYVCIARIPIFQYIMLGKYELSKMGE